MARGETEDLFGKISARIVFRYFKSSQNRRLQWFFSDFVGLQVSKMRGCRRLPGVQLQTRQLTAHKLGEQSTNTQIHKSQILKYKNTTRPNWAGKVRELILFNVLCTVYCGRGCLSLESEGKGKEIMRGCVNFWRGQRTTETRGVRRGPRGPKNTWWSTRSATSTS